MTWMGRCNPRNWPIRCRVLAWFVAGLLALEGAVAANARRWRAYEAHPYGTRLRGYSRGEWDLVLVGGSPAMCGLDPAVLTGMPWRGAPVRRVFNFCLPLGTTSEFCHAAEHVLQRPPRLLVYGVTATDLHDGRLEPNGPRHLMRPTDLARWVQAHPDQASFAARHYLRERAARLWPSGYHAYGLQLWLVDHLDRICPGICPESAAAARAARVRGEQLAENGYQRLPTATPDQRLDCQKAAGLAAPSLVFLEGYRAGGGHLTYLRRLLTSADRAGVPVVLVDLPMPADLEERMYPAAFATYRALLNDVAAERGVPVLRATRQAVGLTDADFADLAHVNADGAAKLSAWVRAQLPAAGEPEAHARRAAP